MIIGFSINYAAYFAEIYRGGIESMEVGYEAAKILDTVRVRHLLRLHAPGNKVILLQ